MSITTRLVTIDDYDNIYALWCSTEQSKRALNPVDDSREGIERYLKRNPNTCFLALSKDGSGDAPEVVGVILTDMMDVGQLFIIYAFIRLIVIRGLQVSL